MPNGNMQFSVTGDSSTKPSKEIIAKQNKDAIIAEVKSGIKSRAKNGKAGEIKNTCPNTDKKKIKPKTNKATANQKEQCRLSGLTIQKQSGTYILNIKSIPDSCTYGSLEVVAGYNKKRATIQCKVLGPVGPCSTVHKTKVFDFTEVDLSKSDTQLKFNAYSKCAFNFFPWRPATNSYIIAANTCSSSVGGQVIVYPDTYWYIKVASSFEGKKLDEIKITGDFKEDQNSLSFSASSKGSFTYHEKNDTSESKVVVNSGGVKAGYIDENTTIGFAAGQNRVESYYNDKARDTTSHFSAKTNSIDTPGGSISGVKIDDMSLSSGNIKAQINDRLKRNLNSLFTAIEIVNFLNDLIETISKSGASPITFNIDWPSIELEGSWQWKEIEGTAKCGFEYQLSGALDPLIGCGVDIDLLAGFLSLIPGIGSFASWALRVIETITGDELKLNLKLNGGLNTNVGISKKAADADPTIQIPNTHIDMIMELSGSLKLARHYPKIGYGGGAKGSSKLIITLHAPIIALAGIDLPCDYEFTGITISTFTYVREGSFFSHVLPDEEDEVSENATEIGTWLKGEKHGFSLALI